MTGCFRTSCMRARCNRAAWFRSPPSSVPSASRRSAPTSFTASMRAPKSSTAAAPADTEVPWRRRAALGAAALILGASAASAASRAPVVTRGGALEGVEQDGVIAYLGIPYAVPPVGTLRWRPPQGLPRWPNVRRADHYGNDCMQVLRRPGGAAPAATGAP